jgi:hypothetical protein
MSEAIPLGTDSENLALDAHLLAYANGNNHPPINTVVSARRAVGVESPEDEDTDNE